MADNRLMEIAKAQNRHYVTPEDVVQAFSGPSADIDGIRLDVLEAIGRKQAEDPGLCAFNAWQGPAPDTLNARDREVFAVQFLLSGESPSKLAVERRFEEARAVVAYIRADVPDSLAVTDPQLYLRLRNRVTELKVAGFGLRGGKDIK